MKILLIEDDKMLSDSLKTLLQGKGFEVEAVYDGDTGNKVGAFRGGYYRIIENRHVSAYLLYFLKIRRIHGLKSQEHYEIYHSHGSRDSRDHRKHQKYHPVLGEDHPGAEGKDKRYHARDKKTHK